MNFALYEDKLVIYASDVCVVAVLAIDNRRDVM